MKNEKLILQVLSVVLIACALVMMNLAIYYSSTPSYAQQGWAIFCGVNAVWVFALGVIWAIYSESNDIAMRQLDRDQALERAET